MGIYINTKSDIEKIDSFAVNGLEGVDNSLGYKVEEIERHFHNRGKWFGAAAVPNGEIHVADRIAGGISPFALLSGNDDFGAWVQVLGSSDTPVVSGNENFDAHEALVTSTDSTAVFIIQVAAGESAGLAAAIAAEAFTELVYVAASNLNDSGVSYILGLRIPVTTKVWARCCCIGQNAKTINFYFGIHEYEG